MVTLSGVICRTNPGWWFGHPYQSWQTRENQIPEKSGCVVLRSRLTPHKSLKLVLPKLVLHCLCELPQAVKIFWYVSPKVCQHWGLHEQRGASKKAKLCGSTPGWILTWLTSLSCHKLLQNVLMMQYNLSLCWRKCWYQQLFITCRLSFQSLSDLLLMWQPDFITIAALHSI